jgi:hypothetical protein
MRGAVKDHIATSNHLPTCTLVLLHTRDKPGSAAPAAAEGRPAGPSLAARVGVAGRAACRGPAAPPEERAGAGAGIVMYLFHAHKPVMARVPLGPQASDGTSALGPTRAGHGHGLRHGCCGCTANRGLKQGECPCSRRSARVCSCWPHLPCEDSVPLCRRGGPKAWRHAGAVQACSHRRRRGPGSRAQARHEGLCGRRILWAAQPGSEAWCMHVGELEEGRRVG